VATETLTIALDGGDISGSGYISGDKDDTQYVTQTDGGNLSSFVIKSFGKDSPTESGEGPGGDDEFYLDLSGFDDDFDMEIKSMDAGDTFYVSGALSWSNVGNVYTINYLGSDSQVHQLDIDLESTNGTGIASIVLTCFTKGTKIVTEFGKVAVESLKQGDKILCGDGQLRPIRWLAQRHVSGFELMENPDFRPIRIRKGALGDKRPSADLCVSPQHRILVNDWRAELLFGEAEVLVPAIHLSDDKNITRDYHATDVTYFHFMFDDHQTVWSNDLETESFYPGETALEGVDNAAKTELFRLFPDLQTAPETYGETYRPTLKAHEALSMVGA
jgi:Hint domain-containing protein